MLVGVRQHERGAQDTSPAGTLAAVTVVFGSAPFEGTFDSLTYWLAQLAGAAAAACLLHCCDPDAVWQAVALGTPGLAGGLARSPAMIDTRG